MLKLSVPLSLIAAAVLSACAGYDKATPAPGAVVVAPSPAVVAAAPAGTVVVPAGTIVAAPSNVVAQPAAALRAGIGRIESIAGLTQSASTGAARPSVTHRIGVKMDDGTVQFLDTDSPALAIGDRIEITSDGYVRHPVP
jgi:hypothetical protein